MRLSAAVALSPPASKPLPYHVRTGQRQPRTIFTLSAYRMQQLRRHRIQRLGNSPQRIKAEIAFASLQIADHRFVDT
jgi:hypothetical protein